MAGSTRGKLRAPHSSLLQILVLPPDSTRANAPQTPQCFCKPCHNTSARAWAARLASSAGSTLPRYRRSWNSPASANGASRAPSIPTANAGCPRYMPRKIVSCDSRNAATSERFSNTVRNGSPVARHLSPHTGRNRDCGLSTAACSHSGSLRR